MSHSASAEADAGGKSGFLDVIERVGNKVPNPTIMFVYLIGLIAVLSAVLSWAGVQVTDEVVMPVPKDEFNQINEHLGGTWSIYGPTRSSTRLPKPVASSWPATRWAASSC